MGDTGAKLRAAMAEVDVSCDKINSSNRTLKKEGVPGMKTTKKGSNVCFKSRVGNPPPATSRSGTASSARCAGASEWTRAKVASYLPLRLVALDSASQSTAVVIIAHGVRGRCSALGVLFT